MDEDSNDSSSMQDYLVVDETAFDSDSDMLRSDMENIVEPVEDEFSLERVINQLLPVNEREEQAIESGFRLAQRNYSQRPVVENLTDPIIPSNSSMSHHDRIVLARPQNNPSDEAPLNELVHDATSISRVINQLPTRNDAERNNSLRLDRQNRLRVILGRLGPTFGTTGRIIDWNNIRRTLWNNPATSMEIDPSQPIEQFDSELPSAHSYLGDLDRVSGLEIMEPGKLYRLPLFVHHSLVFPGETLPMIFYNYEFPENFDSSEGLMIGVVYSNFSGPYYGVTCQIYEKGTNGTRLMIKGRAVQRFIYLPDPDNDILHDYHNARTGMRGTVRILPEIVLEDPYFGSDMNSFRRLSNNTSIRDKIQRYQTMSNVWPKFVYQHYDIKRICEIFKQYLSKEQIEHMPSDSVAVSFWLARNLPLDDHDRVYMFQTNSVANRFLIIKRTLNMEKNFYCRECDVKIASYLSVITISKEGLLSNFCNPSGYIHETYTVSNVLPNSVFTVGVPSTEFSWFPGYSWEILNCDCCRSHIGWLFRATKSSLIPRKFYGLSGSSVIVSVKELKIDRELEELGNQANRSDDLTTN